MMPCLLLLMRRMPLVRHKHLAGGIGLLLLLLM
jgi:hypothetical protein